MFTREFVATPPKEFCFSIIATLPPSLEALIAAKTPVQLPPNTQISNSPITGSSFSNWLLYCLFEDKVVPGRVPNPKVPNKVFRIKFRREVSDLISSNILRNKSYNFTRYLM
jgi:hypothetical protein